MYDKYKFLILLSTELEARAISPLLILVILEFIDRPAVRRSTTPSKIARKFSLDGISRGHLVQNAHFAHSATTLAELSRHLCRASSPRNHGCPLGGPIAATGFQYDWNFSIGQMPHDVSPRSPLRACGAACRRACGHSRSSVRTETRATRAALVARRATKRATSLTSRARCRAASGGRFSAPARRRASYFERHR